MLRNITVLVFLFVSYLTVLAQNGQGTIEGKMTDRATGEPLPFANVVVMKGGSQIAGTMTDFDGKYTIPALSPGTYDIQATYVGYQPIKIAGVIVNSGKITYSDIKAGQGVDIEAFEVIEYEVPLISKDQTSSGGTVTREDIAKMPGRSAASVAATVGGVGASDGNGLTIRGSRGTGTVTFIDGVKVRGSQNLPNAAIEQVTVVTGGIPAEFGDATGGVVNITTRGASKEWFGGLEYFTSGYKVGDEVYGLDQFGNNLLGFSVAGPLKMKKDSAGNDESAIVGFFLSGELRHNIDAAPLFDGDVKVKDNVMESLNADPFSLGTGLAGGVINNAEYLRAGDLERTPFRLNVASRGINLAGKIDVTTSETTNLTFGGSMDYGTGRNYGGNFSLLNFQDNSETMSLTWRTYGRFTQRFKNSQDQENASLIKNAYISFQLDYTNTSQKTQHAKHQDNLSHYGYLGKFTTTRELIYSDDVSSEIVVDANGDSVRTITGYFSQPVTTLYEFEASDLNPILSNYTSNYYEIFKDNPQGNWITPAEVEGGGALLNGANGLANVYNMWGAMGGQVGAYQLINNTQFRLTAAGSASLKGHAIKLGFEYEQRNDAFYQLSPSTLWRLGRQFVNAHTEQNDYTEGTFTSEPYNNSIDRFTFQPLYDAANQSNFDKSIREKLGLAVDGLEWIDFDSYGPDLWDVEDFSADELLRGGNTGLNYAGYDHTGKKLTGNSSLDDFFTEVDDDGNFTRTNGAFRPIYVAGYIQDKFSFDDLVFNLGVRVDRFDANQPVLNDPYTLFPAKTVGELGYIENFPSNIADDFVVYVADAANPSKDEIVGYRDGDTWYNSEGQEISDPSILNSTGIPAPWLVSPEKSSAVTDLDAESFKDYEPQVNVSPRIAFSFPISDEALFFAHYDVLVQRPVSGNRLELIDYLLMQENSNVINNPNLKAEKSIDYELGFQQKLDNFSAITITGYYREKRDQIQITQVVGAFPENYQTFGNLDFSTVKGMTVRYDLRRKGNITLRANYTLQFAEGTGSSISSSSALINSGNGNLRTLSALSFDQRHAINLTADYRYKSGKGYNGPVIFGKNILANTGLNITYALNSGAPYTKRSRIVPTALLTPISSPQEADLNGSRLPWTNTVNLRLDRDVQLRWGKGEDEDRKTAGLNIYLQVLNALNTRNILGVYPATGVATDDGYLAAAEWQNSIATQLDEQSFRDLYEAKISTNRVYAAPRRVRLGMQLNF